MLSILFLNISGETPSRLPQPLLSERRPLDPVLPVLLPVKASSPLSAENGSRKKEIGDQRCGRLETGLRRQNLPCNLGGCFILMPVAMRTLFPVQSAFFPISYLPPCGVYTVRLAELCQELEVVQVHSHASQPCDSLCTV